MINFEKFTLGNGLRVIVHEDVSTPMAVVDVIYDVGARDENPEKTGFAHLFEHLMFGGSINIPSYDEPLQMAGGENNAFTTNDLTNYYSQLPAENIETAFWLESDRMLSLAFSKRSLDVQRKVVMEEFKEHYINKPYGDAWHKFMDLSFKVHPYRWMTIGKELKHIETATLDEVKQFFWKHYTPQNAVLVVAGNVKPAQVKALSEKWFGSIPAGEKYQHLIPHEPIQENPRHLEVKSDVPFDALYKGWHIASRTDPRYYVADLITEILGGGGSSRLFQALVKEKKMFSNISCYHLGSTDEGLLVITGKLVKGVRIQEADEAVYAELEKLMNQGVLDTELEKVKNRTESAMTFEDMSLTNRAASLAMYELLGDPNLINTELGNYQKVSALDILNESRLIFNRNNCNTMYYLSNK
ncbi:MAG: insulinase family protein [Bacteroidetes bacterium]|nr:insulinase family protein [Bacteroidota bacterium]